MKRTQNAVVTKWRLSCGLALPWRPFICVDGSTVHTYDPKALGKVIRHEEFWEVSPVDVRELHWFCFIQYYD